LVDTAGEIARLNGLDKCPLVIHFARFEVPFLVDFHDRYSKHAGFPFKLICTHVIAKRLFPELPRRSLRAMAGYFGYSLGQTRRCSDHVLATAFIWHAMLGILRGRFGIKTLEQLREWLDQPFTSVLPERTYPMADEQRSSLPHRPGVYRMRRSNGDILYIGKAGSLRNRVNSYFHRSSRHPEHILEMLSQAKQLDVTETGSVLEAAILESDEIKRLAPPYNVALRRSGRNVWFCARDYHEFSTESDALFRIGPLASQESMKRLAAIVQVLKQDNTSSRDEKMLRDAVGIPETYAPDTDCIISGLDRFLIQYHEELSARPVEQVLKRLGQELWLMQQTEDEVETEENRDFELKQMEIPAWTPESIVHLLESNIARGNHEMRRARWLVLLSESSLAWEECLNDARVRFLIVFNKGQILYRKEIEREDMPVPPGYGTPFRERQHSFDLMTFDRMRVVTTEMRKIVSGGRWIKLRLGSNSFLDANILRRFFKWV
jgi:DNA polymerase-3 subunit epsilon